MAPSGCPERSRVREPAYPAMPEGGHPRLPPASRRNQATNSWSESMEEEMMSNHARYLPGLLIAALAASPRDGPGCAGNRSRSAHCLRSQHVSVSRQRLSRVLDGRRFRDARGRPGKVAECHDAVDQEFRPVFHRRDHVLADRLQSHVSARKLVARNRRDRRLPRCIRTRRP